MVFVNKLKNWHSGYVHFWRNVEELAKGAKINCLDKRISFVKKKHDENLCAAECHKALVSPTLDDDDYTGRQSVDWLKKAPQGTLSKFQIDLNLSLNLECNIVLYRNPKSK